jgi:chlorobactene glucosyltransferase
MIALLLLAVLVVLAFVTILNVLSFPRLKLDSGKAEVDGPLVSILVPARDEAGKIGSTVRRLMAQDGAHFEVVVLDDHSSDGTAHEALAAASGDSRFRLLLGADLPPGWLGKNWACAQLAGQARGEILVFTDADVRWEPGALRALLKVFQQTRAALLTIWPIQETVTWSERLIVPMMTFTILAYLPELAVRFIPWPVFAAANGQCLVFWRTAYDRSGGHAAVRASVLDDMSLAWNIKRSGLRLVQALGAGLMGARMYSGWRTVREGFAKNILAGHGGQPLFLLLSAVFHWALFLWPWLWLPLGVFLPALRPNWPEVPAAMIALGLGIRLLSASAARHRLADALFLPVSTLLMTVIAAQSMIWRARGTAVWKGRRISQP